VDQIRLVGHPQTTVAAVAGHQLENMAAAQELDMIVLSLVADIPVIGAEVHRVGDAHAQVEEHTPVVVVEHFRARVLEGENIALEEVDKLDLEERRIGLVEGCIE